MRRIPMILAAAALTALIPSFAPAVGAETPRGRILFSRYTGRPHQYDLFIARPGRSTKRLTRTGTWETSASFSPDGSRIAFAREKRENRRPVWFRLTVMDVDGSNEQVLAEDAFTAIAWSPDGDRIAYETLENDNARLFVVDVSTGDSTLLDEADYIGHEIDWAPDSSGIVYSKKFPNDEDPFNDDLFFARLDGSSPSQLTDTAGFDSAPSFSPDGSHIVFSTTRDDPYSGPESDGPYSAELYVMEADGSDQRALTHSLSTWDEHPQWSPDGRWIVYERRYDDDIRTGPGADTDLLLIRPDGSGKRALTDNKGRGETGPVWSPDGRWIAFDLATSKRPSDVYIVERSGRSLRPVADSRRPDYVSDWG